MSKFTVFVLLIILRLVYQPASASPTNSPFTSLITYANSPATIISFKVSQVNHKVLLEWMVGSNEMADRFLVEKSSDGKVYSQVALVFGTDKRQSDTYPFYEKAGKQKIYYRIKLISKDNQITYSRTLPFIPAA